MSWKSHQKFAVLTAIVGVILQVAGVVDGIWLIGLIWFAVARLMAD